jgi:hypothetical protein
VVIAGTLIGGAVETGLAQSIGLGLGVDEPHPIGVTGSAPVPCNPTQTNLTNSCNLIYANAAGIAR